MRASNSKGNLSLRSITFRRGDLSYLMTPGANEYNNDHGYPAQFSIGMGPTLLGSPPVRFNETAVVNSSGSRLRFTDHGPRDVSIPITIRSDEAEHLETVVNEFMRFMDPIYNADPLRIEYTNGQGDRRWLGAEMIAGQEGLAHLHQQGNSIQFTLILRADDPYWHDMAPLVFELDGDFIFGASNPYVANGVTQPGALSPLRDWTTVVDLEPLLPGDFMVPALYTLEWEGCDQWSISYSSDDRWVDYFGVYDNGFYDMSPRDRRLTVVDSGNTFSGLEWLDRRSDDPRIVPGPGLLIIAADADPVKFELKVTPRYLTA